MQTTRQLNGNVFDGFYFKAFRHSAVVEGDFKTYPIAVKKTKDACRGLCSKDQEQTSEELKGKYNCNVPEIVFVIVVCMVFRGKERGGGMGNSLKRCNST